MHIIEETNCDGKCFLNDNKNRETSDSIANMLHHYTLVVRMFNMQKWHGKQLMFKISHLIEILNLRKMLVPDDFPCNIQLTEGNNHMFNQPDSSIHVQTFLVIPCVCLFLIISCKTFFTCITTQITFGYLDGDEHVHIHTG